MEVNIMRFHGETYMGSKFQLFQGILLEGSYGFPAPIVFHLVINLSSEQ
jgi:hypothetical protein